MLPSSDLGGGDDLALFGLRPDDGEEVVEEGSELPPSLTPAYEGVREQARSVTDEAE